jgi:hypothetical protein
VCNSLRPGLRSCRPARRAGRGGTPPTPRASACGSQACRRRAHDCGLTSQIAPRPSPFVMSRRRPSGDMSSIASRLPTPSLGPILAPVVKAELVVPVPKGAALTVPPAWPFPVNQPFLGQHCRIQEGAITLVMVPLSARVGAADGRDPRLRGEALARVCRRRGAPRGCGRGSLGGGDARPSPPPSWAWAASAHTVASIGGPASQSSRDRLMRAHCPWRPNHCGVGGPLLAARSLLRSFGLRRRLLLSLGKRLRTLLTGHVGLLPG